LKRQAMRWLIVLVEFCPPSLSRRFLLPGFRQCSRLLKKVMHPASCNSSFDGMLHPSSSPLLVSHSWGSVSLISSSRRPIMLLHWLFPLSRYQPHFLASTCSCR